MANDFDILIGVDMSDAESRIKASIDNIATNYPLKLQVVLANEKEVAGKVQGLVNLAKNLQTLDVNFGLGDDAKQLQLIERIVKNISKQDVSFGNNLANSMESITEEAKKARKEINNVNRAFNDVQKIQTKIDNRTNRKNTTIKTTTGNEFINQTDTRNGDNQKSLQTVVVQDIKSFNKFLEESEKNMNNMHHVARLLNSDFVTMRSKLVALETMFKEGDTGFDEELKDVRRLINSYNELEKVLKDRNRLLDQAEMKLRTTDTSLVPKEKVNALQKEMEGARAKANKVTGGSLPNALFFDEDILKNVNRLNDETKELGKLNSDLQNKQNALVKLQDKLSLSAEKWRNNSHLAGEEIDSFEKKFNSLSIYSEKFADDLKSVQREFNALSEKEAQVKAQKLDTEKAIEKISKERANWEDKIVAIEREGLAHHQSIAKLKRLVGELDSNELRSLSQVKQKLDEIEKQYIRINQQKADKKFENRKSDEVQKLDKRVNNNLDEELIGKREFNRINREVQKIFETDSVEKLENAIRRVVAVYDELLEKQAKAIALKKEELLAEKDREKVINSLAEMEKKQRLEEWEDKQKQAELQSQRWKEEQELADQMAKGRAKSERTNLDQELKDAKREAEEYNAEQDRIYQNQQKINEATTKYDNIIKGLRNNQFFDESDLNGFWQMMDNISEESKDLTKQLKQVDSELDKIANTINSRIKKQDSIDLVKMQNDNKANDMFSRGLVPENMIDQFKQLNNMLDFESDKKDIAEIANHYRKLVDLEEQIKKAGKEEEKIRKAIQSTQENLVKTVDKYNDKAREILNKTTEQISDEKTLNDIRERAIGISTQMLSYKQRGIELSYDETRALNQQLKEMQEMLRVQKALEAQQAREKKTIGNLNDRADSNHYRATRGISESSEAYKQIDFMAKNVKESIENLKNLSGLEFEEEVKRINQHMTDMNRHAQDFRKTISDQRGSMFGQLGEAMKKVPVWMGAMGLFFGAVNQVQQGFQSLLDVDSAMTNLGKVTEATNAELEHFKETASSIGQEMGIVASDVINATAEFQKLGYSLQQSTLLGKNTLLYANVGDMDVATAQENIVSAVKGFNIEVDESGKNVRELVDMFNEVSNNYAISAQGIGEALRRSSAVLNESGNTVAESIGLVTSANTTIQDPAKVGNAMKTISMRLRGVAEDGESVVGLVPELEKTFKSFGGTLMKDETTFKSTFEIFNDLADVWNDGVLTDLEKANLVELIGGKEQGAIVSSMLNNWADATGAYESAINSAGSAQKEFNSYMDSFEFKIGRLKASMEDFWITLLNDDGIKSMIDTLNSLVNTMTKFVSSDWMGGDTFITEIVALIAYIASPKLRGAVSSLGGIATGAIGVAQAFSKVGSVLKVAVGWLMRLSGFLTAVWAISKVGQGIYNFVNRENIARKEQISLLEDQIAKTEELQGKYNDFDIERYSELENKGSMMSEDENLEYLNLQEQVKENMPEMVAYYDDMGRAVLRSADSMKELIQHQNEALNNNRKDLFELQVDDADFKKLEKAFDKAKGAMKSAQLNNQEIESYSFVKDWIIENEKELEEGGSDLEKNISTLMQSLKDKLSENPDVLKNMDVNLVEHTLRGYLSNGDTYKAVEYMDSLIESVKDRNSSLSEAIRDGKFEIAQNMDEYSAMLDESFSLAMTDLNIKANSNEGKFVEAIKEQLKTDLASFDTDDITSILKDSKGVIEDAFSEMEHANIDVATLFNLEKTSVDDFNVAMERVIKNVDKNSSNSQFLVKVLEELRAQHIKTASAMSVHDLNPAPDFQSEILPTVNSFVTSLSGLDSAYRQLSDGQQLSIDQVLNLITQYPELTKHLENHNGTLRLSSKAIKELAKIKEQEFKADLQIKRQEVVNAQKKTKGVIESIQQEIKGYQLLNQAKEKASKVKSTMTTTTTETASQKLNNEINKYFDQRVPVSTSLTPALDKLKKSTTSKSNSSKSVIAVSETEKKITQLKEAKQEYEDLTNELAAIDKLLNTNFSANLGSIGSIPKPKAEKEKKAKEAEKTYTDMIYVADKYQQKIDSLNASIEKQQNLQERHASFSTTYRKSINAEISLQNQKKSAIDAEIRSLQKQINARKIQQKGLITVGQEDNRTARAKSAELQSEIDEAKTRLNELKVESDGMINTIADLRWALIESNVESYNTNRENYEDDIAYAEYMMTLYSESSASYRSMANTKMTYLKKQLSLQKSELSYLEAQKKKNKSLNGAQLAELQSLINEAKKGVYDLNEAVREMETTIGKSVIEQNVNAMDAKFKQLANSIEKVRDNIKFEVEDGEYKKEITYLNQILAIQKNEQKEVQNNINKLKSLQKQYAKNVTLVEEIKDEITNWQDELSNVQSEIRQTMHDIEELQNSINSANLSKLFESMDDELERYTDKIEELRDKIQYNVKDGEYEKEVSYLKEIYSLQKGSQNDILQNIAMLKEMQKVHKGNFEMTQQITDEIEKWEDALKDTQNSLKDTAIEIEQVYKDVQKAYQEAFDEMKSEYQTVFDELKRRYEDMKQNQEQLADDYVEMYKEQLELMQKAEEEHYKNQMETQEKAHENRIKQIDKELEALESAYDKTKKMMDKEEATRDYEKELGTLQEEAQEIRDQISALSMDDSYEAQSKISELNKELKEKELEIAEHNHDREVELRQEQLEEGLEVSKKQLEDKKTKYEEDYESWVEIQEKMKEERDKYWEQELQNERKFAQLRQSIFDGNYDEMLATVLDWSALVDSEMAVLGASVTDNFTMKMEEAIEKAKELKDFNMGEYNNAVGEAEDILGKEDELESLSMDELLAKLGTLNQRLDEGSKYLVEENKKSLEELGDILERLDETISNLNKTVASNLNTDKEKVANDSITESNANGSTNSKTKFNAPKETSLKNSEARYYTIKQGDTLASIANKYYGKSDTTKLINANPSVKSGKLLVGQKLFIPFKTGGYTGDWSGDSGKLAILHKKELVLTEAQTANILDTAKVVEKLTANLPSFKIPNLIGGNSTESQQTIINNNYHVDVDVASMNGDRNSADIVADQIVKKIKRTKGGRF